jgi:hypothetical protein
MSEATEYLHSLNSIGRTPVNVLVVVHGNYEHITVGEENGVIVSDYSGNMRTPTTLAEFNRMLAEISPGGNVLIVGCRAGGPFATALQNNVRCDINIYLNSTLSELERYDSDTGIAFNKNIIKTGTGYIRNITKDPNGNDLYKNVSINPNGSFNFIK